MLGLAEVLIEEIQQEFPGFQLVDKRNSRLSSWIDVALRLLTLGAQDRFMTEYHTVIGLRLYLPLRWYELDDTARVILLRHERVHLQQRRRLGFIPMALIYLLPIVPLGLALGRARLEWEAYTETLRATAELKGLAAAESPELHSELVRRFTGPDYGWMWPFPRQVQGWIDKVLDELRRGA